MKIFSLLSLPIAISATVNIDKTITLNNGVVMPRVNLGTCCGSTPDAGLASWIEAGGVGIDTAFDYSDQDDIARIMKEQQISRESVFITSKVPAGFGNSTDCNPDPNIVLNYARENLRELQVDYLDLLLIHCPCSRSRSHVQDPAASDRALWKGAEQALALNLTRAIGISNYNVAQIQSLNATVVPSINQCNLGITRQKDLATIDFCQKQGIVYESYGAMKGCPFGDTELNAIAKRHDKSAAQVCLRWALQLAGVVAVGTGSNSSTAKDYAEENLDIFDFELVDSEMKYLTLYK